MKEATVHDSDEMDWNELYQLFKEHEDFPENITIHFSGSFYRFSLAGILFASKLYSFFLAEILRKRNTQMTQYC